jgi:glycosyltransferase involved in cell wall biosynthesis
MKVIIPVLAMGRSGGERVLSKIANELIKRGHDVYFIAPASSGKPYYPSNARIIYSKSIKTRFKKINFICNFLYLWYECLIFKPQAIIANYHLTSYLTFFQPPRVKKIYYVQAYEVKFFDKKLNKLLAFLTYLLPIKKVVNSSSILPRWMGNHKVIPPGVDYDLFYDDKLPVLNNSQEEVNIGILGRVEPHKGTKQLLFSLSKYLKNEKINARVNVAIHLPEECKSEFLSICEIDISSDEILADFYKKNDIFIAVGLIEDGAFHYPCAESMLAGSIVISNYAPLNESDNSLYMKSYSEYELFSKLDICFSLDEDEVSSMVKINQQIVKGYSWEEIGNEFNSLL